ncbi:MAG: DUF91 domain-containing protein [Ahniella sp.]|nr:DUF91 domain-containing protein [Ahniella sp.]
MARFIVVLGADGGGVEVHPMKDWLRNNPMHVPPGQNPSESTSRQLLSGLRKQGWSFQETSTEVRLFPPNSRLSDQDVSSALGVSVEQGESAEELEEAVFQFEAQLRDFIAQNLSRIEVPGLRLRLFHDDAGRNGIEYPTPVGPIDVLAEDQDGHLYVFELKRGRTPDHVIGQLMRYMGCLKAVYGGKRSVHGVIVAREITSGLRYAATVVPNVRLYEYEIQFSLRGAGHLPSGA